MVFVPSSPSCLCFPSLPPFFFKDSDFLIKYPFIHVKSLHSFQSMFLSGDFPRRCSTVLSSSSFIVVSSPVDPIQAFSVDHIPFLVSNAFSCRCTSQSLTSCYSFVLECSRYLGRLVFPFSIRSRYFEVVISFKPFNSTGATSL